MLKMKRLSFAVALLALLAAGCQKDNIRQLVPVKIHVSDFSITQGDYPDAKDAVASYQGVKAITLAFYASDGTEQYLYTQLRADETTYSTFGDFALTLPMGSYTMVVVGYGSNYPITLTSPTSAAYTADRVRETFVATQNVNVTNTSAVNLTATLNRIVPKLIVQSTDDLPTGIDSVNVTFAAGGRSFNPTTGLATVNTGFTNSINVTAAPGAPTSFISYLFLSSNQQTMNITVDVYSGSTNTFHSVVPNVPLQRNKVTVLSGQMFSSNATGSFQVNTSYVGDTNYVSF